MTSQPNRPPSLYATWRMVALPEGHRLHVALAGPEDGTLAILVHGFPDSPGTWRHLMPQLVGAGYRVAAPWLRGLGGSEVPSTGRVDADALADDLIGLHHALGGGVDAVLVGHDWGAVAANRVVERPDSPFRTVVSLAVPPLRSARRMPLRRWPSALRNLWYMPVLAAVAPDAVYRPGLEPLVRHLWAAWSPGHTATAGEIHAAMDGLAGSALGVQRRYYRRLLAGLPSTLLGRPPLQGVGPSYLCLHGAVDGCVSVSLAEAARSSGVQVEVFEQLGHFLHLEASTLVGERILRALEAPSGC